jgi:hypothetical protein
MMSFRPERRRSLRYSRLRMPKGNCYGASHGVDMIRVINGYVLENGGFAIRDPWRSNTPSQILMPSREVLQRLLRGGRHLVQVLSILLTEDGSTRVAEHRRATHNGLH